MAICEKCGRSYRQNWTRTQPCPGCKRRDVAKTYWIWSYGITDCDGNQPGRPLAAWNTFQQAIHAANIDHIRDYVEMNLLDIWGKLETDLNHIDDLPLRSLVWSTSNGEDYYATDETGNEWHVYRIELRTEPHDYA